MKRPLTLKGIWYPAEMTELDALIGREEGKGNLVNAVLPHAGLYYSAPLISAFFASLSGKIRNVMILSPSHYHALRPDTFYSFSYSEAETPYGDIEVMQFPLEHIAAEDAVRREHGIEMFLPSIGRKRLRASFALISRLTDGARAREIAGALAACLPDDTAVIASSDFTHYGARFGYQPYGADASAKVSDDDQRAALMLASGKGEDAYSRFSSGTICGLAPAAIVSELSAMEGLNGFTGEHYTSTCITGDDEDFVSYASVLWRNDD